jgi:hypothetical protein
MVDECRVLMSSPVDPGNERKSLVAEEAAGANPLSGLLA